MTKSNFDKKLG